MTDTQTRQPEEHTELWRLEQLALISQVGTQVTRILDLDELLVRVVGLIYQTFEFYGVSLFILEGDRLALKAQAGPGDTFTIEEAFIPAQQNDEIAPGGGIVGWVAAHQQELVVSDVWHEERFRFTPEFPKTQAEAALPLKVEDRLLGVLDVQLDYPEDFDESDLLVLRALAGQVSMAIEDTRLYAEARRRSDYLASIAAVSKAIASILDVGQLLEQVSQLIQEHFDYPCVQLYTVHYGRRQLEYRAGSTRCAGLLKGRPHSYRLDDAEQIVSTVARTGQTILISDAAAASRLDPPVAMPAEIKSELAIPLIYNDEVLGVLDVKCDRLDVFGRDDLKIMETLADNIAIALRNANLYRSERWRREVADSLSRISGTLITDVNLVHILDNILTELKRNLPSEALAIWLMTDTQTEAREKLQLSTIQTLESFDFPANFDPERDPWLALGRQASEPLVRRAADPADPIAHCLGHQADHSAVVAPLRVQNRLLGLLTLAHSQPRRYGREARSMVTAFANQAAIALENARLFRLAQDEARINSALLKVAEVTQGFGNLNQVLAAVVQIPPLVAGVDRCAIWQRQAETNLFEPEAAFGFSPAGLEFFNRFQFSSRQVLAAERLNQTQAPIVIVDAVRDGRLTPEMVSGLALETLLLLPIVAHEAMLGCMLVTFTSPAAMRQESIRLITGVAHQAAVAIESRSLYEQKARQERLAHELKLAYDIQAKLIPSHLPAPPGWEIAALWQSAEEVAGDFYDLIELSPTRRGIVIADVAGKGMPAALYMTLTRSLIRASAPGQTDPRKVLTRTNQLLVPDTQGGRFVSLFYAILNIQTGQLSYANAGHNPPLLVRANGQGEALQIPGLVLGVQPEIEPEMDRRSLEPGDGVVFYTDGVTEVFNASDEIFGIDRLTEILQHHWATGPQALVTRVHQAVTDFSAPALPSDDFTLLIIRRTHA